ncbi:Fur family transcriptional regulator [Mahella sp.]|uniref:Fur family transcriptional regulator n=1 Tax=Mahella sp. TaxID=2798721 RepID=UPI0025C72F3D|nr:Fur family transcriptional regulator [Mahella sp.]MBZ4666672.1 ferric uptake regulator, Fur family [Mahella sp.]
MLDYFYRLLKENNLRITPQRKVILEILYNCRGHHLGAENIYELLTAKDNDKKIGLATVYRTLELFEKIGIVSRLSMENSPARYELVMYNKLMHHHLICLKCGQLEELDDSIAEEFKNRILEDKGFEVADKSMKIYGYCSNCRLS